uniref:Uncharacterized protein n=1 Tax=Anguilla anguilla TaxID=7936 RepID=A0A0E9TUI6_ANGAN
MLYEVVLEHTICLAVIQTFRVFKETSA